MKTQRLAKALLLALVVAAGAGCSTVQPWQKGALAKTDMGFDPDPLEARFAQHTYFSKESASGGYGVGGGGCGCN